MNSALTREPSQYGNLPRTLGSSQKLTVAFDPGVNLLPFFEDKESGLEVGVKIQEVDACEETMINILRSAFLVSVRILSVAKHCEPYS